MAEGFSRSQARGHPKPEEPGVTQVRRSGFLERLRKPLSQLSERYLKRLFRGIRKGKTFEEARGAVPKRRRKKGSAWTEARFTDLKRAYRYARKQRQKAIWVVVKYRSASYKSSPFRSSPKKVQMVVEGRLSLEQFLRELDAIPPSALASLHGPEDLAALLSPTGPERYATVIPAMDDQTFRQIYPDEQAFVDQITYSYPLWIEVYVNTRDF